MTSYPPPPPVRKLMRSRSNRMLGGVCAGVANYLNMDVTLVRILTVVLSLFTGIPIVAYLVMLFVVPEEDPPPYVGPQTVHVPDSATQGGPGDPVWGPGGAPWERPPTSSDGPTPTAEPGPAPADPAVPNEAAPVADPEPVADTATPTAAPDQQSTWESTPAEPESNEADQKPDDTTNEKPAT